MIDWSKSTRTGLQIWWMLQARHLWLPLPILSETPNINDGGPKVQKVLIAEAQQVITLSTTSTTKRVEESRNQHRHRGVALLLPEGGLGRGGKSRSQLAVLVGLHLAVCRRNCKRQWGVQALTGPVHRPETLSKHPNRQLIQDSCMKGRALADSKAISLAWTSACVAKPNRLLKLSRICTSLKGKRACEAVDHFTTILKSPLWIPIEIRGDYLKVQMQWTW